MKNPEKIAVTSQNFRTITGHAGKTRRFLILDAQGQELERLNLEKSQSFHEWHEAGPHPVDCADAVITTGCGDNFRRRMEERGIRVVVTDETDPKLAVQQLMRGAKTH